MSKRLPKATLSTMSDIHRESAVTMTAAAPLTEPAVETVAMEVLPAHSEPHPPTVSADTALRRTQATLIVQRYTTYSALGGCIPLTLFDVVSVGAIVFNMVRTLADHYHAPFQPDRLKTCLSALIAGVASPTAGSLATQILGKIIPGAWIIGTAVSSAAAAALTRGIGELFIEHFESGGTALNFDLERMRTCLAQRI